MDELLFLAFANSQQDPLATLQEEYDQVYSLLSRRAGQGHYTIHRDHSTTIPKIAEFLGRFRDSLALFLFSGHAGRDRLFLEDQSAQAEGIASMLGQCPRLRLVVLNGCSTQGQVARLLALPNHPAVIATSAPVGDRVATQFSITFFQALCEQSATLEEAFEAGVGAARMAAGHPLAVQGSRGFDLTEEEGPLWGLFVHEGYENNLSWKLPGQARAQRQTIPEPNHFLINGLMNSLAPYDQEVRKLLLQEQQVMALPGAVVQNPAIERQRRSAILKCLPFPISMPLQKLLAKRPASMEGHDFYNEFGIKRLEQLLVTYNTVIELPAFILLAQLWDALMGKQKLAINAAQRRVIEAYLQAPPESRLKQWFFSLLKTVNEIFAQNQHTFYVGELANMPLENDTPFYNAIMALELKKERIARAYPFTESELADECLEAEEKLAAILKGLSFLAGYSLVSVRNIDVLHNRQMRTPNYLHRLVRLVQHFSEDPTEEIQLLDHFLDNASVLMIRKSTGADTDGLTETSHPENGAAEAGMRPLNLTPFVVDENAFVEKAEDHKLYYFHDYEPSRPLYRFQHIYKPRDPLLEAHEGARLQHLMYQFQVFWNLLNNQNDPV